MWFREISSSSNWMMSLHLRAWWNWRSSFPSTQQLPPSIELLYWGSGVSLGGKRKRSLSLYSERWNWNSETATAAGLMSLSVVVLHSNGWLWQMFLVLIFANFGLELSTMGTLTSILPCVIGLHERTPSLSHLYPVLGVLRLSHQSYAWREPKDDLYKTAEN